MNRVLITGGAGYIGSVIANLFHRTGYKVIVVDNNPKPVLEPGIICINTDIRSREAINKVFNEYSPIDCVIHCAGELGIERSYTEKVLFYDQIVYGTDCLIDTMIKHNVRKLIFSSTAAVYSSINRNNARSSESEHLSPEHMSPYSLFKYMCEEKITRMSSFINCYCCLRFFNVVGAESGKSDKCCEYLHKNNLLPILINCAISEKPFYLFGTDYNTADGTCVRDYISVEDLSDLHLRIYSLMNAGNWSPQMNGIYNAGSGRPISVKEMIQIVEKAVNSRIKVVEKARRPGDAAYLCADNEKTLRFLNWKASKDIEDVVKDLVHGTAGVAD